MTIKPKMRLPSLLPRWATDVDATLDPPEELKDTGWQPEFFDPARIKNWLSNLAYEWIRRIGSQVLSNFHTVTDFTFSGGTDLLDIGYWPDYKKFYIVDIDGRIYLNDTDYVWSDTPSKEMGEELVEAGYRYFPKPIAYRSNSLIFGTVSGKLWYYAYPYDGWLFEPESTVGGSGAITAMDTSYRVDDTKIIATRSNVTTTGIRICTNSISTPWVAPSTPPTGTIIRIIKVLHVYASTWFILGLDGVTSAANVTLHKSIDDGDTWEAIPVDWTVVNFYGMDIEYSPDTGTLIMSGRPKDNPRTHAAMWSTDQGDNWEFSTITQSDVVEVSVSSVGSILQHCGGSYWIATKHMSQGVSTVDLYPSYFLSCDDGVTFEQINIDVDTPIDAGALAISCDNQKIHLIGREGFHAVSQAVVLEE